MDRENQRSALLRLLALALSDGNLQREEEIFLIQVAERYGVNRNELLQLFFQDGSQAMQIPHSAEDRFDHLIDLAMMMLMDQRMTDSERRLFRLLGTYLGFTTQTLERVLMVVREEMQQVPDWISLKQQLRRRLPMLVN